MSEEIHEKKAMSIVYLFWGKNVPENLGITHPFTL